MRCYKRALQLLPAHAFLGMCDMNLQIGWPGAILPIGCSQRLKGIWLDVKAGERKCISVSLVLFRFPFIFFAQSVSRPEPLSVLLPPLAWQVTSALCAWGCRDNGKPVPDEQKVG